MSVYFESKVDSSTFNVRTRAYSFFFSFSKGYFIEKKKVSGVNTTCKAKNEFKLVIKYLSDFFLLQINVSGHLTRALGTAGLTDRIPKFKHKTPAWIL